MAERPSKRIRLLRAELERLPDDRGRVHVELGLRGGIGGTRPQTYLGTAEGGWSEDGQRRYAAEATLQALQRSAGAVADAFKLLEHGTVDAFGTPAVIVKVSIRHRGETRVLVGFCLVDEHPAEAAAKAVLNSTNRFLSIRD